MNAATVFFSYCACRCKPDLCTNPPPDPAQIATSQPIRGRRESQQPLNVNVAGRRESHIHFTPFSGRPKNHIHLTIHFPAGRAQKPASICGPPANIHFTSILRGKMDVKWMLAGGPKMEPTSILHPFCLVKWM